METMITHALIVLFGTRILPIILGVTDEVFLKEKRERRLKNEE